MRRETGGGRKKDRTAAHKGWTWVSQASGIPRGRAASLPPSADPAPGALARQLCGPPVLNQDCNEGSPAPLL